MKLSLLHKIKKFFTYQWQKKLISLAVALLLWGYFFLTDFEEKSVSIPIRFENLPADMLVLSTSEENATLNVRARSSDFNDINLAALATLSVNLENSVLGTNILPIQFSESNIPAGVSASLAESEVTVTLDEISEKEVPLTLLQTGSPASGYLVESVWQSEDSITISGPSLVVDEIEEVKSEPINISTYTNLFFDDVELTLPAQTTRVGTNPISVRVEISEKRVNQTATITVEFSELADGLSAKSTPTVSVVLDVPQRFDSGYESLVVVTADCSSVQSEGRYLLPLTYTASGGVTILSKDSEYISVQFTAD